MRSSFLSDEVAIPSVSSQWVRGKALVRNESRGSLLLGSLLKKVAVRVSDSQPFELVLRQMERRNRARSQLRVLAYHRIDERRPSDPYYPGLISASPQDFAEQIRTVAERYQICSMQDVVNAVSQRATLAHDSVLLTFDDATTDFCEHAWPVLKSHGVPATVFVPTAYPDQHDRHFWWDRLYRAIDCSEAGTTVPCPGRVPVTLVSSDQRRAVFRQLKEQLKNLPHHEFERAMHSITVAAAVSDPDHNNVMGWATLRELAAEGLTLAPHTHTHPMLNQLSADEVAREIQMSCEVLESEIGSISRTLAYPAGGVNGAVIETLSKHDIDVAFSTQRGVNDQSFREPRRLRRINVGANTTLGLLRGQLANWGR